MMLRPLTLPDKKHKMLRFCSSRTICTAASLDLAHPTIAAKPGIRPSTSWIPQDRNWMSSMAPFRCPSTAAASAPLLSGLVKAVPPARSKPGIGSGWSP